MNKEKKKLALLDIMKFIFACMIVLIHLPGSMSRPAWLVYDYSSVPALIKTFVICPFMRIGVPFFFIASSYFLFKKAEKAENKKEVISGYVKRNLILYGIWLLLNVVYAVKVHHLYIFVPGYQTLGHLKRFMEHLIFGSTFGASWFLMACVIDSIILGIVLYGIKSEKLAWIISVICFLLCCLTTNYRSLLEGNHIGELLIKADVRMMNFHTSFLCGFIYFMIGRAIVKNEAKITLGFKQLCILEALAFILMQAEFLFQNKVIGSGSIGNTSLMLPVVAALSVILCIKCDMEYKPWYQFFRNASIIMYCTHRSVFMCLKYLCRYVYLETMAAYVLCIVICAAIAWVIITLSKKYKVFRYLY